MSNRDKDLQQEAVFATDRLEPKAGSGWREIRETGHGDKSDMHSTDRPRAAGAMAAAQRAIQ